MRIAFQSSGGTTALQQVANTRKWPFNNWFQITDPEMDGVDEWGEYAHYEPFTFETGTETVQTDTDGVYIGNWRQINRTGKIYSATDVVGVAADGAGARLTINTTLAGRQLIVRVLPDQGKAIRVVATLNNTSDVMIVGDTFVAQTGEAFRGFGGVHSGVDQRGRKLQGWSVQENFGGQPITATYGGRGGAEGDRYLYPNGPTAAYYPQNLFYSNRGYGFMAANQELTRWRMAPSDNTSVWQVLASSKTLDYTVTIGTNDENVKNLTSFNGRNLLPPEWAQRPMLSRNVRQSGEYGNSYIDNINADISAIQSNGLASTIGGYAYEGWHGLTNAQILDVNQRLNALGIKPLGYIHSQVQPDAIWEGQAAYDQAIAAGYLAKRPDGSIYKTLLGAAFVDFTNPAARTWFKNRLKAMFALGFEGYMEDFGEQVTSDMRFFGGQVGQDFHNKYVQLYHQTGKEARDEYKAQTGKDIFAYSRSGISGRPGTAGLDNGRFPGDETTEWGIASGLGSLTSDMLNGAVGGAWGFTTDIGGYTDFVPGGSGQPTAELFTRWSQWAALSPYFRVHNSGLFGVKMPWSYDPVTLMRFKAAAQLHTRSLPLMRSLWTSALATGIPPVRPLWLQFPAESGAARIDQQWMLGSDVLVAPVVTQGSINRSVYFPTGCWRDTRTGAQFNGPTTATVSASLDTLPYFFRCGTTPF
ncbi:MAG: glycoside hydrolase family 31 protein [Thermoleophilaceae bacterium]|nr:glycoside hydrolase family 31 protein [Thermoleophilaceae bacterium]